MRRDPMRAVRVTSLHLALSAMAFACAPAALETLAAPAAEPSRYLVPGRPVTGRIQADDFRQADGSLEQMWLYVGERGERLRITLDSEHFDAQLTLVHINADNRRRRVAYDNDSGTGTNAKLEVSLPYAGTYMVIAGARHAGTGDYGLLLERLPSERDDR